MKAAVCFYTLDTWNELKKVADDKKQLDDEYADWLVGFTKAIMNFKEQGIELVHLHVDIKDLQDWCKEAQA